MTDADLVVFLRARRPDPPASGEWRWVRWPDFGLPASDTDAFEALTEAHEWAASGRVLLTCDGGVGRTGTALALLAGLSGTPAADAVAFVRREYHPRAVETGRQERWVSRALRSLR